MDLDSMRGGSRRITAYTIAIAKNMGVPREEIQTIARGAFLQDIGKMGWRKSGIETASTAEQMERMRNVPYQGYRLLIRIPDLKAAAEIVYAQWERYDGTGYPRQLRGDQIPLGARILAVANALESITLGYPDREPKSFDEARSEIQRGADHQFDPQVVSAVQQIPTNILVKLKRVAAEWSGEDS